jgi:hypothetical protein
MHTHYTQPKKWILTPTITHPPEEEKIPSPPLPPDKKYKKIQKNYKKILTEYKKNLSPHEYRKFEEETQYDILLYDAIIVSQDKTWKLLEKIEYEKWEFYVKILKKILD